MRAKYSTRWITNNLGRERLRGALQQTRESLSVKKMCVRGKSGSACNSFGTRQPARWLKAARKRPPLLFPSCRAFFLASSSAPPPPRLLPSPLPVPCHAAAPPEQVRLPRRPPAPLACITRRSTPAIHISGSARSRLPTRPPARTMRRRGAPSGLGHR